MTPLDICNRLRSLRKQRDWTQEYISIALDISIPAYSKIESGSTDINLSRLMQIAKLYDMSISQVLSEDEPKALQEIDLLKSKLIERNENLIKLQEEVIRLYRTQEIETLI